MERQVFERNGKKLALYLWETKNAKGVVQMVHGMAEHMGRYNDFAEFLNLKGYIFVGLDLRCHGFTDRETLGYSEGDIWEESVADNIELSEWLKAKYRLPLIVMGHSYGSFLTQRLIETNRFANAFILSGSCYMKGLILNVGHIIAKNLVKKDGKQPATILFKMTFASYDKAFGGEAKWLSKDTAIVEKYKNDELCGYCCSASFYESFFRGLKNVYDKENLDNVSIEKPIYIFSGAEDPVGKKSKGVIKLYEMYKKLGVEKLSMKLYEKGRHEMLNETNKAEVYADVCAWLNKVIESDL